MTKMNLSAAIKAGLIAGLVFMILEMLLVATVGGGSPWGPPRMIAAIVEGQQVLPPPATFDMSVFLVAMAVHFALSIVLAIVFGLIADMAGWSLGVCAVAGLVFGVAVYLLNFYGMTAVFPWFAMARSPVTIFSHAMFGLVLGYLYRALAPRAVVTTADEAPTA